MSAEVRLLSLSQDGESRAVAVGERHELAEGISLTVRNERGDAIIEREGKDDEAFAVSVNGGPSVLEIAHVKPLDVIDVAGKTHVVLPPFGVFVRRDAGRQEKEDRLATHFAAELARALPGHVPPSAGGKPNYLRLATLALAGGVIGIFTMLYVKGKDHPRGKIPYVSAAISGEANAATTPPIPEPDGAPAQATVRAPDPVPVPTPPAEPVTESASVPEAEVVAAPVAAPDPAKASIPQPKPKAKPDKPQAPAPVKVSSDTPPPALVNEGALRKDYESYRLEAGFDPEGAATKMKRLKARVPAGTKLAKDVEKALKDLGQ